jgi:hypothetical protein
LTVYTDRKNLKNYLKKWNDGNGNLSLPVGFERPSSFKHTLFTKARSDSHLLNFKKEQLSQSELKNPDINTFADSNITIQNMKSKSYRYSKFRTRIKH